MNEKMILCYGDSNTHGYNAGNGGRFPYESRWTGVMAAALGDGYRVAEEGLSGRTSVFEDPIHEGMSGLSCLYPIMMSHEPLDTLIVMLGTNDTKDRFGVNGAMITAGMERLLLKARTVPAWRDGKADIVLVAPSPMDPRYKEKEAGAVMGIACDQKSAELAERYRKLAKTLGCRFLDAGPIAPVHPNDYTHLTAEGHAALGKALARMILEDIR